MKLRSQKNLIERKEWNCFVILDACKWDYFKEVHENYLDGDFKK